MILSWIVKKKENWSSVWKRLVLSYEIRIVSH